jgi:hypothetical protein
VNRVPQVRVAASPHAQPDLRPRRTVHAALSALIHVRLHRSFPFPFSPTPHLPDSPGMARARMF